MRKSIFVRNILQSEYWISTHYYTVPNLSEPCLKPSIQCKSLNLRPTN